MHYSNLVIVKPEPDQTVEEAISAMLGEDQPWFDWYQIGGRWTGLFDGYNPEEDPANIVACDVCGGTGTRPRGLEEFGAEWLKNCNGCNGCQGEGKRAKWPTQFKPHPGDVVPMESVTAEHFTKFHRVVCDYGAFACEEYTPWNDHPNMFPKKEMPPLDWLKSKFAGYLAVVVDNHN